MRPGEFGSPISLGALITLRTGTRCTKHPAPGTWQAGIGRQSRARASITGNHRLIGHDRSFSQMPWFLAPGANEPSRRPFGDGGEWARCRCWCRCRRRRRRRRSLQAHRLTVKSMAFSDSSPKGRGGEGGEGGRIGKESSALTQSVVRADGAPCRKLGN